MIRYALRRVSYNQFGIALTFLSIGYLHYLVATDLLRSRDLEARWLGLIEEIPAIVPPVMGSRNDPGSTAGRSRPAGTSVAGLFARIGYRLDAVRTRGEVPRIFLASLPSDLFDSAATEDRKVLFIKTTLPLILHVNELIARDRERLLELRDAVAAGIVLSQDDQRWLAEKAKEYGLPAVDFAELARRIDVVPPSLALAQSAEESGWGTSRFAREGNALFGQRIWREGEGMMPRNRSEGEAFRVAAFGHLIDGVKSYVRNLNTHPAYEGFRRMRSSQRRDFDSLDSVALAGALSAYSERGAKYVQAIRKIIRSNMLEAFDRAWLSNRVATEELLAAPDA